MTVEDDRIMQTFLVLLKTTPYEKLLVRTIMRQSGVTRTVFYVYFDNKDDLARETLSAQLEDVILHVSRVFTSAHTMNMQTTAESLRVLRSKQDDIRRLFAIQRTQLHLRAEFQDQVAQSISEQVRRYWPKTPPQQQDYFSQLFAASMIATILWFFQHQDVSEADLVQVINTCVFQGLAKLLTD